MSNVGYFAIQAWLNGLAISFREMGYLVEYQHAAGSLRLRLEGGGMIGELCVWETLKADAIVTDLNGGHFVFESYGTAIGQRPLEKEFKTFLGYFLRSS